MTKQAPLKASPLVIERHEFLSFRVDVSDADSPKGLMSLHTIRQVQQNPEEPRHWMVDLTVEFGSRDDQLPAPYMGSIAVRGWFEVANAYPEERQVTLIEVTATSILYGACREMLASFTARSSHGIASLPSVSFAPTPSAGEESAPALKPAKKRATAPHKSL
jgi:hypothetical protein